MIDLTGRWQGSYSYPGSLVPVPFTTDLRDSGGLVSGLMEEEGQDVPPHATCSRRHDGATLTFTKIYESTDRTHPPIRYEGAIEDEGHEISGRWVIAGDWSGPFVMIRPRTAATAAAAEEAVEL